MLPPLFAILTWPAVSAILFNRMRVPLAVVVTILGGFLLLPQSTAIDLPLLPPIDKYTVPALMALLLALAFRSRTTPSAGLTGVWSPLLVGRVLMVGLILSAFATVMTNADGLSYGPRFLAGLRPYDAFALVSLTLMLIMPLFLARKYLARPEDHRMLLLVICIAGLAYSLLALIEIRLSPQLNRWVYGFFPHSWIQHVRGDGFRPVVFLSHGLVLAVFFSGTILASLGLSRLDPSRRGLFLLAAFWLLGTLVLAKSLGALAITLVFFPLAFFLSTRAQLLVAAIVATIFLSYPILRGTQLIPLDSIMAVAEDINPLRASSLQTRLDNEELILAKARERPFFGWGTWGRWRIYDDLGRDVTISDGYWVIIIGVGGWTRYLFEFGLLTMPIFLLLWRSRRQPVGLETSTLALILAANLVDLIPNSGMTPLTWILAGALWGRAELETAEIEAVGNPAASARAGPRGPGLVYARASTDLTAPSPSQPRSPATVAPGPPAAARKPAPSGPRYSRQTKQVYRRGAQIPDGRP